MFKKQVLVVLSLVMVFSMLLSSCGTAATPAAAPATAAPATAAPATAAPATAVPATAAPATAAPATAAPAGKVWKIGFLAGTVDPFYTTMQRGATQAAADLGVDLITQVPQTWNVTAQTPMLDAMVARGDLNFLFLAPVDSQAMIAPLQAANTAGLPILTVDTYIGDGDYAGGPVTFPISFIASDNYLGGQIACRALADALNKTGKIYIQNVKPGISSTDAREKGCKDVVKAEYPNVKMVGVDYNNDDATQAQAQVQAMLQKNPDLGGIFGTNVFSAQGAGTTVKNLGLSGKVKVVAFDATKDAINMLSDGTVDMVIAQKPSDMGYLAVEMAVAYLNGVTSIPKHIPTGYAVITKANMTDPNVSQFFYSDFSGTLPRKTGGVKLGFLAGTVDPFYTTMQRGAQAASDAFGADLITQVPQTWNVTAQTPMLDAMVARGDLKFLFLAPVDSQAMIAPLQAANAAGLPILTVDTYIGDGDYAGGPVTFPLSFIASDNYLGGQIACRALADALNKTGKIYIQNVKPGISSTDAREKGCKDVLKAEYPNITMVGVDYNNDDATQAQAQVQAMLQKNPDLGGIFGTNVFSAQGAGTTVKNLGLSGKVKVVAFDATKDAINMLSDGTVDMVIAQKPGDMGFLAVEMAMAYLDGVTSIPKHIPTGYAVITKANMTDPNIMKFFYK
jgi:ribose transport system substrate-binding protein